MTWHLIEGIGGLVEAGASVASFFIWRSVRRDWKEVRRLLK